MDTILELLRLKKKRPSRGTKRKIEELTQEAGPVIIKKFKTETLLEMEIETVVDYLKDTEQEISDRYSLDLSNLEADDKYRFLINYKLVNEMDSDSRLDIIKILNTDMDIRNIAEIVGKMNRLRKGSQNENKKLRGWVDDVVKIPFGEYVNSETPDKTNTVEVGKYLTNIRKTLDENTYGQKKTKDTLVELVASWITNPKTKGKAIGLLGEPGVGKTSLIRDGLAKALNRPFVSMSLAGINDDAYLSGHGFTYEGSKCGKIVDMLVEAECMNPIIFMDELDKVSDSRGGKAIISKLIEIIDYSQNNEFEDLYFSGIKIDLSKCIFIFSLNSVKLNPILMDRIEVIKCDSFKILDKISIARDYLIKIELDNLNLKCEDIVFTPQVIEYIVRNYSKNKGVRDLKCNLGILIRKLNTRRYIDADFSFPVKLTDKMVKTMLPETISEKFSFMYL
jgi:ATP-dependent Lon protease